LDALQGMTKLNKKRIKWLVDQVAKYSKTPKEVAPVYNISERRVQQLVKQFNQTKKYPELNTTRRPKTLLSVAQKEAINRTYQETGLSPRLLYHELKRRDISVAKNKVYAYLKQEGLVRDEPKKQQKRKRCRYEWPHTGDMLHADYHRTSEQHPFCIFWLDDASRKILAAGEFEQATKENAIETFKLAEKEMENVGWHVLRVNTDRGSQFFANKGENAQSGFQKYLEGKGIKFIPSRVNNPQTNGKVERRWKEYDKHRWKFNTLQEWVDWYNNRLTTALEIEQFQTPNKAFIQKLPNLFGFLWGQLENGFKTKKY
jgi:putative transposase